MANTNVKYSLFNNSRFYILLTTVLLSIFVMSFTRMTIATDQLFYIRSQQLYGFLCILYWYLALIISPIGYVIGKQRIKHLVFSRRAIGVSAAYFAVLHASVAFWGQLGGISGFGLLPSLFKWSIIAGLIGVIVLLLMAATSFDKVINIMTYRKWKWLHRLVYAGGVLAVLHIWSIGTHLGSVLVQIVSFVALIILSGLELFRIATLLSKKHQLLNVKKYFNLFFLATWLVVILLIGSIPKVVDSYRDNHSSHDEQSDNGEHGHE